MKDFRDLQIWQRSHALTLKIYGATAGFPKEEQYGLIGQMRRSTSSVPTNIAEGCGRNGDADFARFLQIAMGSASELEDQLILSRLYPDGVIRITFPRAFRDQTNAEFIPH